MTDDPRLGRMAALLASRPKADWRQSACDTEQMAAVTERLDLLAADDLEQKFVVAGLLATPYIPCEEEPAARQACVTCIDFEHRQLRALPQMLLPVEAQWSCVLWRI